MGRQDEPLKDEAARREEWRRGETRLGSSDAAEHTLPASEDDDETLGGEGGDAVAHPRTIAPPD
jgi:hypothetical protein